jgi:hypothetical protein
MTIKSPNWLGQPCNLFHKININTLQKERMDELRMKNILDGRKDGRTEEKQYTPLPLRGAGV